jgi:hypothetical protein
VSPVEVGLAVEQVGAALGDGRGRESLAGRQHAGMDVERVDFDGVGCSGTAVVHHELELVAHGGFDLAVADRGVLEVEVPDVDLAQRRLRRFGEGECGGHGDERGGDPLPHAP